LEVAESVNLDGTINYSTINSTLKQSTKEKNIGFFYSHKPTHDMDASINFSVEHRQDISGVKGNDGMHVGFSLIKKLALVCGIPDTGLSFLDQKLKFAKNPKCLNKDGKIKKNLFSNESNKNIGQHGLVYDIKTDMFVPIKEKEK
jgi:hypothetical protein